MVRKRGHWRFRSTSRRPKTPAPKGGWVIADLSRITQIPVRRIRYYVERDLIQPIERRGTATRYPRGDLLRLLALPLIRTETTRNLVALKREFERLGEAELERLVTSSPLSPAASDALGVSPRAFALTSSEQPLNAVGAIPILFDQNTNSHAVQTWQHVELLPGLTLLLGSHASAAVRGVAKRLCEEFRAGPTQ
jgi:hypothetical protein